MPRRRWMCRPNRFMSEAVSRLRNICCALCVPVIATLRSGKLPLAVLYAVVFVAGLARGFAEPAFSAWEAQIIPPPLMVMASAWFSSTWLSCAVLGPVLGGVLLTTVGPAVTFGSFAICFCLSLINVSQITSFP